MKYIKLSNECEKETIKYVVEEIRNGGVVILPTDTVYGIVADAMNTVAVKKIYSLKKRPMSNPCNILVSNMEMLKSVTRKVNEKEQEMIEKYFPRSIDYNI